MSIWQCPSCKAEYKDGDYPDHWAGVRDKFEFDCECGTTFDVAVDWSPQFWVDKASARRASSGPMHPSLETVGNRPEEGDDDQVSDEDTR